MEELWSLDKEQFIDLKPVYGYVECSFYFRKLYSHCDVSLMKFHRSHAGPSFGTFRSSRPHSVSFSNTAAVQPFCNYYGGLGPVHQWFFLSDPCLFLATYSEKFRLIFLFKWTAEEEPSGTIVQDSRLDNIFFAKQVWNCLESPGSVRG